MQIAHGHLSNKVDKPEASWRLGTFSSMLPVMPTSSTSLIQGSLDLPCWAYGNWHWNSNEASHDAGTSKIQNPSFTLIVSSTKPVSEITLL